MDRIIFKDLIFRYWKWIAIIVLAILLFHQCNRSNGLIADAKSHEKKANEYLAQARATKQNSDNEIVVYKAEVNRLNSINAINESKLSELSKTTKAKLSDLRHYNSSDISEYYKDRYNETTNVIQVENGTTLKDTVSKKVISDLIVGDASKAEVKILRDVVKTKDAKFTLCDATVDSLKIGLETVTNQYELANSEKDKALFDVKKAFRHERNKKILWQLSTIAAVLGSGYLLLR